jgi:hypothetical protein
MSLAATHTAATHTTSLNQPLNMSSFISTAAVPTYDHKAGKVIIFNRDNFPDWQRTCEAALIMAEGWDFVTGDEDLTRVNTADRRKQRGEALKIIFISVESTRQEEIRSLIKQHDIQGM